MSYTIYNGDPLSILVTPGATIDDILPANPDAIYFYFGAGNYYITDILKITRSNISFIGLTGNSKDVHIFQNNVNRDGINVISDGFIMKYISVHVPHDNRIALIVASASNTLIQYNYFYGNKTTFSIYYAGPRTLTVGQSTLDAYDGNLLDKKNYFQNNVVYSEWSGDCVSYSLQRNGKFTTNIIRGGKLAVYMCRSCTVTNNTIYDSINEGIHVSLPTHKVNITNNKIYECQAPGIKLSNQVEHGAFVATPYNINIKNNYIYDSKSNSIELNDALDCVISGNKLISSELYGIYMLRSNNIAISDNKISYFKVCVWVETSSNNEINNNTFLSVYPDEGNNIVKLTTDSNNNNIHDNTSMGKVIYTKYIIPSQTVGNVELNNTHTEYYDIAQELTIMK